jgi:hypothetical protein
MKYLFAIWLLAFCVACSSKETALKQTDTAPQIGLVGDTVFVREKDPLNLNGNGVFAIQALPANHQLHLQLYDSSGAVHFSYRGQSLSNNQPVVVAGEWNSLFCKVDTAGIYGIELSLRDQLGRISRKPLIIKAAAAQRPVAALQWKVDNRDITNRRYYFDAGGCAQPYGKILSYHYSIGGQNIKSATDKLTYIFHQKGVYPISFFVVDDLGQHSDTIHQNIDVL